ncbi:UDP-glucuronosyl/UDP-glucosyltransferase [Parasponia andersonii]|uniref:UDP-glucuronosyl/UDP-glucosyltransferase n=1 Tax=Parasponia andersonii TaxID=3476 RepID=A0A2P5AHY7_PARAD|nr:UDP-glucuronosyl/UDP-glucosyltransferase [Parasponia andersonii]
MPSTAVNGSHVLVYPYPSSGHVIPFLDLTRRLLTRGFTVTVLVTPQELPLLQPLISTHSSSSLKTLVVPVPEVPASTPFRHIARIKAMRDHHEPALIQWFQSHATPPVVAILSDFFLGWTQDLSGRVGVKRIVFSPSGACGQSISFTLWKYLPKKDNPNDNDDSSPISFPNLPNSPTYPWWQILPIYRNGVGDPIWEFYRSINVDNMASWGIVFNSFAELENRYLDHLKREVGHDRVWAVGPLLPDPEDDAADNSVVYVCFGNRATPTSAQTEALTTALEQSRVHFILCLREPDPEKNAGDVSEGFEGRVGDRGLVIRGWAPQLAILSHRAVGAFLTHCGWNSVVEGLAAGVVLLTWPMGAEQYTNAELVVEQAGAGVRIGEGTRTIPDPAELARLLVGSLEGSNEAERVRAKELSRAAMEGVVQGGSSDMDLDDLVKRLNELSTWSSAERAFELVSNSDMGSHEAERIPTKELSHARRRSM